MGNLSISKVMTVMVSVTNDFFVRNKYVNCLHLFFSYRKLNKYVTSDLIN